MAPARGARQCAGVRGLGAALALCTGACALLPAPFPAADDWARLPAELPADFPARVELAAVPYYPQEDYQCGPAALAMALSFAGVPRTPQELQSQVYLPERHGALQPEMLAAARRAGLVVHPLPPRPAALLQEIAAGNPVVVLEDLGTALLPQWPLFPRWHYAVVVGYDRQAGTLLLRSGPEPRRVEPYAAFARAWSRGGNWAFTATVPGRVPASAGEDDFVAAAARLEGVQPLAAAQAYRTALARWPQDLVARIGLGNLAYGRQALPEAEAQYRQATADHPDSADAWNNLAQVLHDQRRDAEALPAARRAVALGGPRMAEYRATLAQIAPSSAHAGGAQPDPEP